MWAEASLRQCLPSLARIEQAAAGAKLEVRMAAAAHLAAKRGFVALCCIQIEEKNAAAKDCPDRKPFAAAFYCCVSLL